MKPLNPLVISGREVLPLVEGGKGISVHRMARAPAPGRQPAASVRSPGSMPTATPRQVNRSRRSITDGRAASGTKSWSPTRSPAGSSRRASRYERSNGEGRIHMNVLWEMAAAERVLHGVLEGAKGLINGVTCGAGMPYKIAEICARYRVHYYPIVSSARAFSALVEARLSQILRVARRCRLRGSLACRRP